MSIGYLKSWLCIFGSTCPLVFRKNTLFFLRTRKNLVSLNPANIRLGEDVLKTAWRRFEDVFSVTFFCLPRHLENVLKTSWRHNSKTSCKHVLKTSWRRLGRYLKDVLKTSWRRLGRRLGDISGRRIANTSGRRLKDVLKTSWKTKSVTLKTSSRRLQDVLKNKKCLVGICLLFEGSQPQNVLTLFLLYAKNLMLLRYFNTTLEEFKVI